MRILWFTVAMASAGVLGVNAAAGNVDGCVFAALAFAVSMMVLTGGGR